MKAIDVHAHVNALFGYKRMMGDEIGTAVMKHYRIKEDIVKTEDEMARDFIDNDVKGLIISWDTETTTGSTPIENDYVAGLVKRYPDAYLGSWAMIDPWKGEIAIKEIDRAVKELGMIGVKFQPIVQAFYPNDRHFYPIYEKCDELKVPVSFHTGSTGWCSGMPGAKGYRLKYTKPIPHIDDVAADFPNLTIIMIHPSWPWYEEQIAILIHKGNVYADLSGYAPKYFPEATKKDINSRCQDKFMFGSDYPEIPLKRWLDEFESGGYRPEVIEKVLYKNAERVFNFKL